MTFPAKGAGTVLLCQAQISSIAPVGREAVFVDESSSTILTVVGESVGIDASRSPVYGDSHASRQRYHLESPSESDALSISTYRNSLEMPHEAHPIYLPCELSPPITHLTAPLLISHRVGVSVSMEPRTVT